MQTSDAIYAIKERINIVDLVRRYVDLKPNGNRFVAPCPFHQETKPSFSVNPDRGFFYCFGCHAAGDIFEFHSRINGIDFGESLRQLAEEAGVRLDGGSGASRRQQEQASERQLMLRMHEAASSHFAKALQAPCGAECREYMQSRGISQDISERFGIGWAERSWRSLSGELNRLGYSPELASSAGLLARSERGSHYDRFRGRMIFPIKNLSGQVIAFGGRIIGNEDEAKYINSSDTPIYHKKDHLYGLFQARRGIATRGRAILTEGYMDVLTLHQYGYDNGIGVLGTALTGEQIQRISGFTSCLVLVFDGDNAGRKAAMRSAEMLLSRGLSCLVVHLPEGEDIDSFLKTLGPDAFDRLCSAAPDGLRYFAGALAEMAPRDAIDRAKAFLANMRIPELVSSYASRLAQILGISEKMLREVLHTVPAGENRPNRALQTINNMRDVQIMIFAIRYPEKLNELREIGADLALNSPGARQLWSLLEQYGPDEVFYHLNDRQKNFWHSHRGPTAAPLATAEHELACLKAELAKFYEAARKASISAALAEQGDGDFATDLEYLRALQETMGTEHEQS